MNDLQKRINTFIDSWFDDAIKLGWIIHRGKWYRIIIDKQYQHLNDKRQKI